MVTGDPLISIIMATYNRCHFIGNALDSILDQTYKKWECIIIDDGSSDKTEEVIQKYIVEDQRFKYLKRGPEYKKGLPGSRNCGLDLAKGNYVIFFDDDDIVHPQNLTVNLNTILRKKKSFCRYEKQPFIGSFSKKTIPVNKFEVTDFTPAHIPEMVTGSLPFASCTVLWQKSCFAGKRFNEDLQYAEEWEFYSRILSSGVEGVSINAVLYFNRKHNNSNTGEFYNNDPIRRESKIRATKFIIKNLYETGHLNKKIIRFFIRLGFELKDFSIIRLALEKNGSGRLIRLKYKGGFLFYPVIKPMFFLKGKIISYLKF